MLTGSIVTTNCTAALSRAWVLGLRTSHGALHHPRTFQGSSLQRHWGTMKRRDVLLREEERAVLAWLTILLAQGWMLFCGGAKGKKRQLLSWGGLVSHRSWRGWRVGTEGRIPQGRGEALKPRRWGGGGGSVNWAAIVVRITWRERFIKVAQSKGSWVTAIHLQIIHF